MYAEYPAIFNSYLELARSAADPATALEALKRAVFLVWWSVNALPVETGLTDLPETEARELMELLDSAIKSERADDELRLMLAWYRDAGGYVFDHFGPVRSLDGFIREVSTSDVRRAGRDVIRTSDRGQLGRYWKSVLGERTTR